MGIGFIGVLDFFETWSCRKWRPDIDFTSLGVTFLIPVKTFFFKITGKEIH